MVPFAFLQKTLGTSRESFQLCKYGKFVWEYRQHVLEAKPLVCFHMHASWSECGRGKWRVGRQIDTELGSNDGGSP